MRLHHATRHRDTDVAKAAQSALLGLSEDRRVLRRLLTRLVEPERSDLRQPRDRALFLAASDPARLLMRSSNGLPLLAEVGLRRALVRGWADSLRYGSRAEYEEPVRRWLEACTVRRVTGLLDILVAACPTEFATSATLSSVAFRWLKETDGGPDTEARRHTVRGLLRAVDDALHNDRTT